MSDELKQCTRCLEWFPPTLEYFYAGKHGKGLRPQCKTCVGIRVKETQNPETKKRQVARWHRNNPDKSKAIQDRFNERHPDAKNQFGRDWYHRNAESQRERTQRYKDANREQVLARSRVYKHEHREQGNLHNQRYFARKKELPDDLTLEQWQYALDYFGNACAACGRKAGDGYHIAADHWIPLANEGCLGTTRLNMIPLCHSRTKGVYGACNNSKRSAMPDSWLRKRFGAERAAEILAKIESYFEHLRSLDQATNIA